MMKPKGRKVSGKKYEEADENYDMKMSTKANLGIKPNGIANAMKKAKKGYSKMPNVKGQRKV